MTERVWVQGGGFRSLGWCRRQGFSGFGGGGTGGKDDGAARQLRRPQEEAAAKF